MSSNHDGERLVAAPPDGSDDSSSRDRDIVAHLPDGLAVLDTAGVVQWANESFAAWCGGCAQGTDFFAALDLPAAEMGGFRAALAAGRLSLRER